MKKITSKIIAYRVLTDEPKPDAAVKIDTMHENITRPDILLGSTYKIKTPNCEHAMYLTINDIVLNPDSPHEERRPYEIFVNSKNMEHHQWVIALTRLISAVFRKGGDVTFLVQELKDVFDPKGGFFKKSLFVPSIVAEIGYVLEKHFIHIGIIKKEVDKHMEAYLQEKRQTLADKSAIVCEKCSEKSMVKMDNCWTCTSCGYSKCG